MSSEKMTIPIRVETIATQNIVSVEELEPVARAAKIMAEREIGSILVTRSGAYVGIVTERDILEKVVASSINAGEVSIGKIMSAPLITVPGAASLGDAIMLMSTKHIRRLLVTQDGKISGIFTQRDLHAKILDVFMTMTQISRQI